MRVECDRASERLTAAVFADESVASKEVLAALGDELDGALAELGLPAACTFINILLIYLDELVAEKEKYKDIGDDLDTAFVELILKE
ncbi:unnamed protein product [Colias eurytheme]|nr:unnamed protein product [Colias eurytheme]